MPRHSLEDKDQEWHVLNLEAQQKDRFADDAERKGNAKLALLFRSQAVKLRAKRDRIGDLAWRHIEKINLDKEFKSTLAAVNKMK